ncbi:Uncharacterized conserved protein, Ntn-hydrolase superfamily [Tardiphaga sp. OK246]|jgi:uncharacterized Ntn-hydrolase superfamily protein|uniref:DUF1028 domain-containing protein n=1 Tax=Tardiphaga sp. OK246 TaxID=1855307 RepID=UPI000B683439|nr:DUF1028 domain-containing protein [Tardiphaga sp. OK246]SNT53805.1 Uncharacterized conserved protein, Ntn-hydrolase superfamily [Tardiphaga sp. OK246]
MTFSIAALDRATGMFGIAIATSAVAVGNRCPWVRAGVGAVTTQHRTDTRAGPIGIDLLVKGCSAQETVNVLSKTNDFPQERQFAAVDKEGRAALFNGPEIECINAGFIGNACVSTGNFIANTSVPEAIIDGYHVSKADTFARRLLDGVDAGLRAGGETKPIMSAALLIAHRESWPLVDLRVDWEEQPLSKLRSLWDFYEPHQERFVKQVVAPSELSLLANSPMNV